MSLGPSKLKGIQVEKTKIEWASSTFNPWVGCTRVSLGCQNCYAERQDRWQHAGAHWGPGATRRVTTNDYWKQALKWNKKAEAEGIRYRVFCASWADVFDEEAPAGQQERLWELIEETSHLDWLLLTKRPHRIKECLPQDWLQHPRDNVWLGTSVENQYNTYRVNELVEVPAVVHFLSVEPLLGPIPSLPLEDVEWIIVGGESGGGSRAMEEAWVREIHDQCKAARVPFFFKQWGDWAPVGSKMRRVGKKTAGSMLSGRTWKEVPR